MRARFLEAKDLDAVNAWLSARQIAPMSLAMRPRIGYIVDDMAAGFLYQTDSCVGLLDGYVSNPHAGHSNRQEALDLITAALIESARVAGISHLVAYSRSHSICERALRFGFVANGSCSQLLREVR